MSPTAPAHLSRFLIPVDTEGCSLDALQYAVRLSKRVNAELQIVHVWSGAKSASAEAKRAAQSRLDAQLEQAEIRGVPLCTSFLVEGQPVPAIVEQAKASGCELVLMGTHGRSGLARFVLGSVAEAVGNQAPCPVLTLRRSSRTDEEAAASVAPDLTHVGVPIDFSDSSLAALEYAHSLALRFEAKLHLMHAWRTPAVGRRTLELPHHPARGDYSTRMREYVQSKLDTLVSEAGISQQRLGGTHIVKGEPGRTILATAKQAGCQLIVMGAKGVAALDELILGSVAREVRTHADCPVITVRAKS